MTAPKFSELHIFIDETGNITDAGDALNAVGGVLFFGRYDHSVDAELRSIIEEQFAQVGGSFPEDLHFFSSDLSHQNMANVCKSLGTEFQDLFANRPLQNIQGFSIYHEAEVFAGSENILTDEDKRDNRYESMVQALIEHLIYVEPGVSARMAEDWTLHLHIARRTIGLKADQTAERSAFEEAGYNLTGYRGDRPARSGQTPDRYLVHATLNVRDVEQMLRNIQMLRWRDQPLNVGTIDVAKLDYSRPSSPAGLYLADLYLGQYRNNKLRDKTLNILPTYRELGYGPCLDILSKMALASSEENLEAYLKHRRAIDRFQDSWNEYIRRLVRHYDQEIAPILKERPQLLEKQLEDAAHQVDLPGQTSRGFEHVERAYHTLETADALSQRAQLLYFQASLSDANHKGETARAEKLWQRFTKFTEGLGRPGVELVKLDAEIRNRRAVALTDQLRHEEAREVLIPVIEQQEELAELVGDRDLRESIGACYGTLGQAEAFMGHHDIAESFFRQALPHFDVPADQERQWIYLAHLSSDMPADDGAKLWKEAAEELSALRGAEHVLASGSQYLIALFMKSSLVFSSAASLRQELQDWRRLGLLSNFTKEDRTHHPFGLIFQTRAMCHDRLLRSELDIDVDKHRVQALKDYHRATAQMNTGGPLLQLLGIAASLRRELLKSHLSTSPDSTAVGQAFKSFRNHIQTHFGAVAWDELEDGTASGYFGQYDPASGSWIDRGSSVLQAIRFNYW